MNKPITTDLWLCPQFSISRLGREPELLARLSDDEQQRFQQLAQGPDRERYLLARLLLRTVLGNRLGLDPASLSFSTGEFGKPQLDSTSEVFFNLSHTQGMIVLAVSEQARLGVDAEATSRKVDLLGLAARYFSDQENRNLQSLSGSAQRQQFFAFWTLKEAWVKAKGVGLRIPLDAFSFSVQTEANVEQISLQIDERLQDEPERWHFRRWQHGDHSIALAVELAAPQQSCAVSIHHADLMLLRAD